MQNYKKYAIPRAQLVIADVPYNVANNFYGSNPMWYVGVIIKMAKVNWREKLHLIQISILTYMNTSTSAQEC